MTGAGTADGGDMAMAAMAGSARCSGHSPITISLTTRCGVTIPSFWGYGYGDIYAGIFAPYGYDDLTGYLPSGGGGYSGRAAPAPSASQAANTPPDELSQMCGEDSRDIAGLPIDQDPAGAFSQTTPSALRSMISPTLR